MSTLRNVLPAMLSLAFVTGCAMGPTGQPSQEEGQPVSMTPEPVDAAQSSQVAGPEPIGLRAVGSQPSRAPQLRVGERRLSPINEDWYLGRGAGRALQGPPSSFTAADLPVVTLTGTLLTVAVPWPDLPAQFDVSLYHRLGGDGIPVEPGRSLTCLHSLPDCTVSRVGGEQSFQFDVGDESVLAILHIYYLTPIENESGNPTGDVETSYASYGFRIGRTA